MIRSVACVCRHFFLRKQVDKFGLLHQRYRPEKDIDCNIFRFVPLSVFLDFVVLKL